MRRVNAGSNQVEGLGLPDMSSQMPFYHIRLPSGLLFTRRAKLALSIAAGGTQTQSFSD